VEENMIKIFILVIFLLFSYCKADVNPLLNELAKIIKENTVYEDKDLDKKIVYDAIRGLAYSLDKYTNFMDPVETQDFETQSKGEYGGIGSITGIRNDILTIIYPFENAPLDKAGIKPGDRILKINGESTKNMKLMDAIHKLRGTPGTQVTLTILREEPTEKLFDITVTREIIRTESVDAFTFKEIGYIKIYNFSQDTGEEIQQALRKIRESGNIKGIILDLRDNPGGSLDAAVNVASAFVGRGKLVTSTEGRDFRINRRFTSRPVANVESELPMVVLVNQNSASASELLSGALQDHSRAIILGTKTYGKGCGQNPFPLRDRSTLLLTTFYYYTPKHRCVHEKGVQPDIIHEPKPKSPVMFDLEYRECFIKYAWSYIKKNPQVDEKELKITDAMLYSFLRFALEHGVNVDENTFQAEKENIRKNIKAEIIRLSSGEKAARRFLAEEDEIVNHAIDLIKAMKVFKK
jgi:carboxyl-terminal processing protease